MLILLIIGPISLSVSFEECRNNPVTAVLHYATATAVSLTHKGLWF